MRYDKAIGCSRYMQVPYESVPSTFYKYTHMAISIPRDNVCVHFKRVPRLSCDYPETIFVFCF